MTKTKELPNIDELHFRLKILGEIAILQSEDAGDKKKAKHLQPIIREMYEIYAELIGLPKDEGHTRWPGWVEFYK